MKKLALALLTFFVVQVPTFAQKVAGEIVSSAVLLHPYGVLFYADSVSLDNFKTTTITKLEIPNTSPRDIVITHAGYSLLYNETCKQANWVAYELTKEKTNKIFQRTNHFITDPQVKTGIADGRDYSGSGYDRGHLAPASDMGWSSTTMAESFYYSNMSPQTPGFNRGIWKSLEELVRNWAVENDTICIATGLY